MPSPSISPISTPSGPAPVAKSTLPANEPDVIEPDVLVFLKTETVLVVQFVTAISNLPSPSMSPMAIFSAPVPAGKSTLAANELVDIAPDVLIFLNTETELSL